jgi:DNA-binding transcriptional regulator YhcF (GntR family)
MPTHHRPRPAWAADHLQAGRQSAARARTRCGNGHSLAQGLRGVAASVVRDIISTDLEVGDRLPAESEMLTQYSVGRESLREGLQLLKVQGLISIRSGPVGGPYVARSTPATSPRRRACTSTAAARPTARSSTLGSLEPVIAATVARIPTADARALRSDPSSWTTSRSTTRTISRSQYLPRRPRVAGRQPGDHLAGAVGHRHRGRPRRRGHEPLEIPHLDREHHEIAVDGHRTGGRARPKT